MKASGAIALSELTDWVLLWGGLAPGANSNSRGRGLSVPPMVGGAYGALPTAPRVSLKSTSDLY